MALQTSQKLDRRKYIGGSDIPILLGDSKFKTPWTLFLEKIGVEDRPFSGSLYTEFGNILEPYIQDMMDIENVDDMEFKILDEYYLPIICHIDGLEEDRTVLSEIKTSSAGVKGSYNQNKGQVQMYLHALRENGYDVDTCNYYLLQRNGLAKQVIAELRTKYRLTNLHDFNHLADYEVEAIMVDLKRSLKSYINMLDSSFIKQMSITYDDELQGLIDRKLRTFLKFVEEYENDPFMDLDELEIRFNEEMELL